jgi:hypothetical protein
MHYELNDRLDIIRVMRAYGGGFAAKLAEAYLVADDDSIRRIEDAFPELLEKYAKIAGVLK